MVLLVHRVGLARRHHQAVHALAEFRVVLAFRKEVGARALVARLPGRAAVGGVKHAGRRDADPDLPLVLGMQDKRMQDQPGAARVPVRPRRMFLQPVEMLPGLSLVVAPEQAGRLHAGIEHAVALGQAPHRLDRLGARLIGQALARMRPCRAEILGFPDRRAEPFIAAAAIDRAGRRVAHRHG